MQPPACGRDRLEPVAAPQLLGVHHLAFEELEHERVVLGQRGDDGRADARLRRRDRVVDLVLAVDREEARVLAGDADDVARRRRRRPGSSCSSARRQRLDRALALQLRHEGEDVVERHARDPTS